jgi:hypothetical protein
MKRVLEHVMIQAFEKTGVTELFKLFGSLSGAARNITFLELEHKVNT